MFSHIRIKSLLVPLIFFLWRYLHTVIKVTAQSSGFASQCQAFSQALKIPRLYPAPSDFSSSLCTYTPCDLWATGYDPWNTSLCPASAIKAMQGEASTCGISSSPTMRSTRNLPSSSPPARRKTQFSAPSVALPIANNTLACPHLYFFNKAKEKLCSHRNSASGYDLLWFSTTLYAHHKSMAPLPCRAGPEEADCQNTSVFMGFEFSFVLQVSCLYATVRFCAWIFSGSCPPRHCQACCRCGCFYGFFPSNKLIHSRCWWASFSDRHRKENPSASPRVTVLVTSMPTDAHCRLPPVEDAEVVGEKVAQALLNTNWCCRIVETLNFCLIPFKTTRKRWIFICQVARKLHHNANGLGCRLLASAIRTKLHFIPTPK